MALFTAIVAERVCWQLSPWLVGPMVALGVGSVLYWHWTDDLRFYFVVQFFPLLALPIFPAALPSAVEAAWSIGAGLTGGLGVAMLYYGFAVGRVSVIVRDNKARALSARRRFAVTLTQSCATFSRSWVPAARFRSHGRLVVTVRAIDRSGALSRLVSRSLVIR